MGRNLSAEFQRAETTLLQDILSPSSVISAGYVTYLVTTVDGEVYSGLLASESAASITLKQPQGKVVTILRKQVEELRERHLADARRPGSPARAAGRGRRGGLAAFASRTSGIARRGSGLAAALNEGSGRAVFDPGDATCSPSRWKCFRRSASRPRSRAGSLPFASIQAPGSIAICGLPGNRPGPAD